MIDEILMNKKIIFNYYSENLHGSIAFINNFLSKNFENYPSSYNLINI